MEKQEVAKPHLNIANESFLRMRRGKFNALLFGPQRQETIFLHDEGLTITPDNISKILTNRYGAEPYIPLAPSQYDIYSRYAYTLAASLLPSYPPQQRPEIAKLINLLSTDVCFSPAIASVEVFFKQFKWPQRAGMKRLRLALQQDAGRMQASPNYMLYDHEQQIARRLNEFYIRIGTRELPEDIAALVDPLGLLSTMPIEKRPGLVEKIAKRNAAHIIRLVTRGASKRTIYNDLEPYMTTITLDGQTYKVPISMKEEQDRKKYHSPK